VKLTYKKRKDKKIRNSYRGINKFKRSCRQRTNLEKNEKGDQLAGLHSMLNRRKMIIFRLLNVKAINFMQMKTKRVESLVHSPHVLQSEMGIDNLER
jgi:hypothetical protein